jgi:hypothetical protein
MMIQRTPFETPLLRYWRLLNADLERRQASPVRFGEAIAMRACWRNPTAAAAFVARAQTAGA